MSDKPRENKITSNETYVDLQDYYKEEFNGIKEYIDQLTTIETGIKHDLDALPKDARGAGMIKVEMQRNYLDVIKTKQKAIGDKFSMRIKVLEQMKKYDKASEEGASENINDILKDLVKNKSQQSSAFEYADDMIEEVEDVTPIGDNDDLIAMMLKK